MNSAKERHPSAGGDPASQQKAWRLLIGRIPACAGMTMLLLLAISTAHADTQTAPPQPSIALHGDPKYATGFHSFDYVNPNALKGGTLRLHDVGTFDSLNPFIVKGDPAAGLNATGSGLVYESLMDQSADEPFTMYGVLAESIEVAPDRSWVAFNLRPDARWSDGQKVTADDVVWSFNTEVEKGAPFYKSYYGDVAKTEATGETRVLFTLRNKDNLELPLILAQLTVLPKHYWDSQNHNISDTTLDPPVGSGPYKIGAVSPGRSIEYVRDPKWWGKNLPINKGRWNFDRVTFDYYKDDNVSLEAFFAGQYDVREERSAKMWATAYDAPAVKDGRIKKEDIQNQTPTGMQAYVYNIRKPVFQDRAVRQALAYAFDFDWSNKQFAYGAYTRSRSYFSNSELEAHNTPDGKELEILNKFKGRIPDDVFTAEYDPPSTDGSGENRDNLRQAVKILEAAGWQIDPSDGIRKNVKTGQRLTFEILTDDPLFERWTLPFIQNLQRIGAQATYRTIDSAQYENRVKNFDYDMIIGTFGESNSPGNEQVDYWGSATSGAPGSRNLIGVHDPVVDELISMIIHAQSREDLVAATHALDRVLQWGFYVIPQWHLDKWRIAYWTTIDHPGHLAPFSPGITDTWWYKVPAKATAAPSGPVTIRQDVPMQQTIVP